MPPLAEYTARRDGWQEKHDQCQRLFIRIGNWRLLLAVVFGVAAWFAWNRPALSPWPLATVVAFIALVVWHQKVIRRRTLAERAIRYYGHAIARLQDKWAGTGNSGERFRDLNHVYAEDLDVFGKGSLFELLSNARTSSGEETLAQWLLSPATLEVASARQEAIRELLSRLDLREDLALLGEDVGASVKVSTLKQWGSAPPVPFAPQFRPLAFILAMAGLLTLIAKLANLVPLAAVAGAIGVNAIVIFLLRKQIQQITGTVETPAQDLALLSLLIGRVEGEQFTSPRLRQLRASLSMEGTAASRRIAHLKRWMELLDSSDHILMRVLGPLLLSRQQIAMALEKWRQQNGPHIGEWIGALAEFEALSSLSSLAYERPDWVFPELAGPEPTRFEAAALRHPLIATAVCVPNDLVLNEQRRLLIISGSNMSGKSTLLRAAGLNTILAWAGAPVAATRLRITPLQTGASLRVTDSLQDNRSRFFAEITRLRDIVALTKAGRPVLFLLDELLSGTNSHDRRIGAGGIVQGLLRADTLGMITTHDLALAQIQQDTGSIAENVHFEDRIIDGLIEFDYRLRPGIVTHSNALELMRSIGLDV